MPARIARTAAVRVAERAGCAVAPPALPADLPAQGREPGPADRAAGSRAWYAAFLRGRPDHERLPDRALGAPAAGHGTKESCVPALDSDTRRGIYAGPLADGSRPGAASDVSAHPWWLQTYAYYGDDAAGVRVKTEGGRPATIATGQAQRQYRVLYASATCRGRPAVFAMTSAFRYDHVLGPRLDGAFTACATDTARRRGCTGLVLPGPEKAAE